MAVANLLPSPHFSIISDEISLLYHEFVPIFSSLEEFSAQTIPYLNDIVYDSPYHF